MSEEKKLSQYLPIVFSNGRKIEKLIFSCPHCFSLYKDEDLIGKINEAFKDIFIADALGNCKCCVKDAEIYFRLKIENDVLKQEFIEDGQWKVRYYINKEPNLLQKIFKFISIDKK